MPSPPAQPLRIGSREGKWVLFATILASSMSFLDSTVVNVALPTLQHDFRAELSSVAWVVDAYVLTLTAFILLGGSFGDIFGRRRALRLGLIVFTTGSMLCGLAPTLLLLDVARGIQGIGGALLVPSSLAILTASFDPSERGRAIGLWASLSGIGAAIGPLAGGLIVDAISWRGIFFLNLPIAVFVFLVALPKVPESRDEEAARHIDLPGAAIAAVFLAGLTFALIEGSTLGWTSPAVLTGFVIGGLGFVAFIATERRSPQPMVPLSIFGNRTFSSVNVATLVIYAALAGASLYLVLDVQQARGFSAVAAGASLLPLTGLLLIGSPIAGRLADRVGPRIPMTVGPAVAGTGLLVAAATAQVPSYWMSIFPVGADLRDGARAHGRAPHDGGAFGARTAPSGDRLRRELRHLTVRRPRRRRDPAGALARGLHARARAAALGCLGGPGRAARDRRRSGRARGVDGSRAPPAGRTGRDPGDRRERRSATRSGG